MFISIILQYLYEISFFRDIFHGIYSIISIIKLFAFSIFNKNFIYHYGIFGKYRNIGDNLLYENIEKLFDKHLDRNIWYHRLAFGEIALLETLLINKYCSMLIIGGHGLIMPESNKNNNSGWGFNININNLNKIKIPIIFFAIGYNVFRDDEVFIPNFKEHLNICVRKSLFFGLRNYGSINKVKKYLSEDLHSKIMYQPCPTTILDYKKHKNIELNKNNIAIVVAFNKVRKRYSDNLLNILNQIIDYADFMISCGFNVCFFGHHLFDTHNKYIKYFKKCGFSILPLYKMSINDIYQLYNKNKLIISMRGHGLMVPFGLSIPTISLTNQDKQIWFLETIGYSDWSIDINNYFYEELIKKSNDILNNYENIQNNLINSKVNNKNITNENIKLIKLYLNK